MKIVRQALNNFSGDERMKPYGKDLILSRKEQKLLEKVNPFLLQQMKIARKRDYRKNSERGKKYYQKNRDKILAISKERSTPAHLRLFNRAELTQEIIRARNLSLKIRFDQDPLRMQSNAMKETST